MRKGLVVVSIVTLALLFSSTVFAAAWNAPNNVRIVQKSNTDNVRVFGTITAALNSITNASATNPYVIKVMPGVYDLGTASLQMKEFVDVEGSGPGVTLITSSNYNADGNCTVCTVLMANNMAIRNLKIENKAPNMNGEYGIPEAAVVFNNVTATLEGVNVLIGNDQTPGGKNIGVCTYGPLAHAYINNSYIEAHNVNGQCSAVRYFGGYTNVTNSKLVAFSAGENGNVQIFNNDGPGFGIMKVTNSELEDTAPWVTAFTSDGTFDVAIANSSIALHGQGNPLNGFHNDAFFDNVKISVDGQCLFEGENPARWRFANSQIPSQCTGLVGAKLFNNHDEQYNPYVAQ